MDVVYPEVLIVGSGPIGSAVARILSERRPSTEILMVDAGPQLTTPPGVHVRNIRDADERILAQVRSQGPVYKEADIALATKLAGVPPTGDFARPGTAYIDPDAARRGEETTLSVAAMSTDVGGMGVHWTCACPHPHGGEIPEFVDDAEWAEALSHAQRLLAVTPDAFEPTVQGEATRRALSSMLDDRLPEGRKVQPMPLACRPEPDGTVYWTGTDVILGHLAQELASTFTLQPETLCRRLLVESGRVMGATLVDLKSQTERIVYPRIVVVACDGLRTPQLLWASELRPEALGRYLNDHIQVTSAASLDAEMVRAIAAEPASSGLKDGRGDAGEPLIGIHWIPYSAAHPFSGVVMQLDLSPISLGSSTADDGKHVVGIGHFIPKEIQRSDRVTFSSDTTDVYGMPKMTIHYGLTAQDRLAIERVSSLQREIAHAIGRLDPGREPTLMPNGSSLHYQGTVRMGARDDGTSVCDPYGRVWETSNCYVGGNGVIPTPTAGNTTLSSVAHAVRTAGAIVDHLESDRDSDSALIDGA
jgi:pyranose oxidase